MFSVLYKKKKKTRRWIIVTQMFYGAHTYVGYNLLGTILVLNAH